MLVFGGGKTLTKVTKTLNTCNFLISRQNMGAKVHSQEGNSPDY